MMTFTTRAAGNSVAYNWLAVARHYLGGHRAIIVLAIVAVVVGAALNWSWLAAVGVAPVLLSALPCLVMCGLGLCMNRLVGRSCASASSQPPQESVPPPTTLPVMNQTAPDIAPPGLAGCGRELAVAGADPASHRSRLSSCVGRARPACRAALLDAGYGANTDLRANITTLGLCAEHDGLGARHRAVAAEEMVGPRTTAEADPP